MIKGIPAMARIKASGKNKIAAKSNMTAIAPIFAMALNSWRFMCF
jgi:hypothetical protein